MAVSLGQLKCRTFASAAGADTENYFAPEVLVDQITEPSWVQI